MPKKSKSLCVDDLRHAEYYDMQTTFDTVSYTHLFPLKNVYGFLKKFLLQQYIIACKK